LTNVEMSIRLLAENLTRLDEIATPARAAHRGRCSLVATVGQQQRHHDGVRAADAEVTIGRGAADTGPGRRWRRPLVAQRSRGRPRSRTGPMPMPMPLMRKRKRNRWLRTEPEEKIMLRKPRRARTTTTETLAPLTWLDDGDDCLSSEDDKCKIKTKGRRGGTVALIREHRARPAGRSGGRFQWSLFLVAGPLVGAGDDGSSSCSCLLPRARCRRQCRRWGRRRANEEVDGGGTDGCRAGEHHLVDEIHVRENSAGDADGF
jgi:hypothetical protein